MDSNDAKAMAARNLIEGATLDELRDAVCDLRALSPDSALADLVEAKIEQLAGAKGADGQLRRCRIGSPPAGAPARSPCPREIGQTPTILSTG